MSLSSRYQIVIIILLVVLLSGCSVGRQSKVHREMKTEMRIVHSDSLLLQDLFQASRNKMINVEHIVFDTGRLDTFRADSCITAWAPIKSLTRIAINDSDRMEVKTSVKSGSVSEISSVGSESLQKEHVVKLSSIKWGVVVLVILLAVYGGYNR